MTERTIGDFHRAEDEYLNELEAMPPEQIQFLDKLCELARSYGLSPEEFDDLYTRIFEAVEGGKSPDEVVAAIMGKH